MERLKEIKEKILDCVHCQVTENLKNTDTKELGEAIDMIKDISETMYYYTVIEAMEENNHDYIEHKGLVHHYDKDKNLKYGKSYETRKHFLELKEKGMNKEEQAKELEKYVQELSEDVLEMIQGLSPEEKGTLSQKMITLAGKIR